MRIRDEIQLNPRHRDAIREQIHDAELELRFGVVGCNEQDLLEGRLGRREIAAVKHGLGLAEQRVDCPGCVALCRKRLHARDQHEGEDGQQGAHTIGRHGFRGFATIPEPSRIMRNWSALSGPSRSIRPPGHLISMLSISRCCPSPKCSRRSLCER